MRLLFISGFFIFKNIKERGYCMSTKEKKVDERIAFGNSLSKKRRESGLS